MPTSPRSFLASSGPRGPGGRELAKSHVLEDTEDRHYVGHDPEEQAARRAQGLWEADEHDDTGHHVTAIGSQEIKRLPSCQRVFPRDEPQMHRKTQQDCAEHRERGMGHPERLPEITVVCHESETREKRPHDLPAPPTPHPA